MLFNSIDFAIYLPITFVIYWFVVQRNLRLQNAFLIAASYFFYGWWDWRFLSLIVFSSGVDFLVGKALGKEENPLKRKLFLLVSIAVNLGFLGFFKYYNFFAQSLADAFTLFGNEINPSRLNIILPVGISFYTFQTLGYTIDNYRRTIKPEKDPVSFFAFVSFFPQLVAGPIERAAKLLPQFNRVRTFDYAKATDGMRQILWGLFKKMVVADNCAIFVDQIFSNPTEYSSSTLLLGAILFTFQIYGDFSGYSDIAIGTARLFGFNLSQNFAFPFFSRDIAELWRRWHISLSNWCRDYIYIPLGGNRRGPLRQILNAMIAFVVVGIWHGANYTFIVFGFLQGLYLSLLVMARSKKKIGVVAEDRLLPNWRESVQMTVTFLTFSISLIVFRSNSVSDGWVYYKALFTTSLFTRPDSIPQEALILILICISAEWLQRSKQHALDFTGVRIPKYIRFGIYYILIYVIALLGINNQDFIYFQF